MLWFSSNENEFPNAMVQFKRETCCMRKSPAVQYNASTERASVRCCDGEGLG